MSDAVFEWQRCNRAGWKQLRIGELKTLLALAIGDEEAIRKGCDRIHHFRDLAPVRRLVYRCTESMLNLDGMNGYRRPLALLYGADTVRRAEALLDRSERFFGPEALGADMQGMRGASDAAGGVRQAVCGGPLKRIRSLQLPLSPFTIRAHPQ